MNPQNWLRHRRVYEASLWALFFGINAAANSIVGNIDDSRLGLPFEPWERWAWEFSSAMTWLALLAVVVAFDRRFPLERPYLPRHLLLHLVFTLPVSMLHVLGMVGLRELVYGWMSVTYEFGPWTESFAYEFLKDVRTYAGIIAIFYLYRLLLRRWQGEAEFLTQGREEESPEPVTDRFLVKKLGREFLVKVADIDWIESAGNYVILHVGERLYPLRETMNGIDQKLSAQGFARVHRSALVNLDRVREIEPFDTGDARAHLINGDTVSVSRRFRQELRTRLA